mmetsp:Transcript_16983/g.53938  ORF Transcript_16983/g.53938 Transcript_16983/m.53938 type:complete len:104 (+) Transcript_16983:476-787(+)
MVAFRLLKGKEIGVSDELTDKFLDEKAAKKLTMGPSFLDPALGEGLLSRHKFFTARLQEAVATRGAWMSVDERMRGGAQDGWINGWMGVLIRCPCGNLTACTR